jgi:hypothetical protein
LWSKTDFDQWIGIPIKSKQNKLGFERLAVSYLIVFQNPLKLIVDNQPGGSLS